MSAAEKMQIYRSRRRAGKIRLEVFVDEVDLVELLSSSRLLAPGVDHDRSEIAAAAEKFLEMIAEESFR